MFILLFSYKVVLLLHILSLMFQLWHLATFPGWSVCPFDMLPSFFFFFTSLFSDALGWYCIFLAPALESAISANSCFFYLRMIFRNQDLDADCAYCYWATFILISPILIQNNRDHSRLSPLFVISSSDSKKPDFHFLNLLKSTLVYKHT